MEIIIKEIKDGIVTFKIGDEEIKGHALNATIGGVDGYRALVYARHQILDIKRYVYNVYVRDEDGEVVDSYPEVEDTMDVIVENCTIPEWD